MSSSPVSQRHPLNRALHGAMLGLIVSSYALPSLAQTSSADHSNQIKQWNIAAGPLAPALDRFAREAGISLSFDASSVVNRTTAGVSGTLDTSAALSSLLQGSELQIEPQGPNAYLLLPQAKPAGPLELDATDVEDYRLAPLIINAKVTEGMDAPLTDAEFTKSAFKGLALDWKIVEYETAAALPTDVEP